ncbi:E3 SUMO-protein ligase KIAA1586-like [Montipora capricornis]|uniref:E3 SUMO-protein ligase KIAA1586-like n=1 Tax=Montipora capricornis TaxID=246305 RepID=UPI0035F12278
MSSKSSCLTEGQSVPGQKQTAVAAKLSTVVQPDVKMSSASIKHKMHHKWEDEFPWLTCREEGEALLCSLCCDAPHVAGKNQFLTGCTSTKKETMQKHAASNGHLRAQAAALAKQKPVCQGPIAQSLARGIGRSMQEEKDRKEVTVKITTAYILAKEEIPQGLIDLQIKNGLELTSTYGNNKTCVEIVSILGGLENETVFCRYVLDGHPVNPLIGHKAVEHANAEGLKDAICATFEAVDVSCESKLVPFGADGSSVNLGKKSGLATLLKKAIPYLVDFHCLPCRLELALLELQNSCKSVEDVYTVLHLIWKTYHYSPKSVRALKSVADELQINLLKPTQVRGSMHKDTTYQGSGRQDFY